MMEFHFQHLHSTHYFAQKLYKILQIVVPLTKKPPQKNRGGVAGAWTLALKS